MFGIIPDLPPVVLAPWSRISISSGLLVLDVGTPTTDLATAALRAARHDPVVEPGRSRAPRLRAADEGCP